MKRNLIIGIVLIGAAALSSCSSTKLAALKSSAYDDDVYYTNAKAGDSQSLVADNQMSYDADDNYFYYGDYASRLSRFSSYSPFSYNDDFYYSYVPYNNGFGAGTDYDRSYFANYYGFGSQPTSSGILNNYVYSPYNYGYDPYDFTYDDFGYGDYYSAFLLGGYGGYGGGGSIVYGTGRGSYNGNHSNYVSNVVVPGSNPAARGAITGGSPGITRLSSLPGRPVLSVNSTTGVVTRLNTNGLNNSASQANNNNRQTRDAFRPQQQTQSFTPASSSSASSGGASSAGAGGGGGGGGRPGRP